MKDIRIHAVEGSMVSRISGVEKLLSIFQRGEERTHVFVISPVKDSELNFALLLDRAQGRDEKIWSTLEYVKENWKDLAKAASLDEECGVFIDKAFREVSDVLKAVFILGDKAGAASAHLEALTSSLLCAILTGYFSRMGVPCGTKPLSEVLASKVVGEEEKVVFVSTRPEEEGEGGGEYSAALVAAALSGSLTFWNPRSLLYSASHKDVPNAYVIEHMTYREATELSFFGAPIVHSHALIPAEEAGIPLSLRYWGDPEAKGTLVTVEDNDEGREAVKAFSVVKNISLINVEGPGMSGVPGVSSRIFSALSKEGISVIFISQASSEYSVCFGLSQSEAGRARETLLTEFAKEIRHREVSSVSVENDLSILAVVGEGMPGHVGVAGKFFSSLARAGVNIRAIAQGSSERNISAVIASSDSVKAERALHTVFFMSQQTLSLGLFGPGNIGGTLLDQIGRQSERLRREFDLDIRVRGIATSRRMLLSEEGVDLSSWREQMEKYGIPYNEEVFLSHIKAQYYPHWVLVDATASPERAFQYKTFLDEGFHVITPNKKASSGPYEYYRSLLETSRKTGKRFFYETTVGAGLPIIVTLKDLRETGDIIEKVEGMVSGTLAWLFSNYDGTVPFSSLVRKARDLGFTEPDPRDDLSGMDVARKTVILAREMGYKPEVDGLKVENLVPENLRSVSKEEFLERMDEMDEKMLQLYKEAEKEGKKLRYVGTVEDGKCSVSLSSFPSDHPFSQAKGTDNVIEFTTARYHNQPLVVQGPGAGPEVTAAGIFADILRLSAYLGSKI